MNALYSFAAALFAAAAATTTLAAPRLVVSTPSLAPESTIDLVFDLPVVDPSAIGKAESTPWLEIEPALPGILSWKAQNIAEFRLTGPPRIGTAYSFSIPEERKHLDGSPVPAGGFATIRSEEFRVVHCAMTGSRWSPDFSPSTATWLVVFNDAVDPAAAAAHFSFDGSYGQRVAAIAEPVSRQNAGYYGSHSKPWNARFPRADDTDDSDSATTGPDPEETLTHALLVRPQSPLPPGKPWRLTIPEALPNLAADSAITKTTAYNIGEIAPFKVSSIDAETRLNEPRLISVTFNHPLPAELPENLLGGVLEIEPRPPTLEARASGRSIEITGDLADHDSYLVRVRLPFASRDGLPLTRAASETIKFERITPSLRLPSDDQAQLAHGSRSYSINTENIGKVHVRAKKLSGTDLIRAYQGYRHYKGVGPDGRQVSPTSPLPWPLIAGEAIMDREIDLETPVDSSRVLDLNWDELLPAGSRHAALFLDVIGTPHPLAKADGRHQAQAIIQLTDIGLAWKLTPREALVYAFSCDTGAPLPGVKLQLFGEDAAPMQSAETDAAGLVTLPRDGDARHLLASTGDDAFLTAYDETLATVGLWHFPVRYSWSTPPESRRQVMMFTDRSLYRPGETVRLKGIVRTLRGNAVEAAGEGRAQLIIRDPQSREIVTEPVTISANGSFDFSHQLGPETVGSHLIQLEFPDELAAVRSDEERERMDWYERQRILENAIFEIPLRVEQFRRNAFEITQEIPAPPAGAATAEVVIAADYYQGQPVANGSLKTYTRIETRNPYPERFRDFQFGNHRSYDWAYWYHYFGYRDYDEGSARHSTNLQSEATLGSDGKTRLNVEIPETEFPSQRELTVATEVTDANLQTLTARSRALVHPADAYIGISRIDRLVRAGEELPLRVIATDTAGEPYTSPLELTATLTREINRAVRTVAPNGATTTRNDTSEETATTTRFTLDPAASAAEGHKLAIKPAATGLHFLTIRGTDPQGRGFATVTRFHVYGTKEYPWLYEDGMRIKLVGEKKSWQPGETARVLVLSPIEGTALVTVEREKVLRTWQVALRADNPVIEIPLDEDDAPNVFVSVLVVKGARESAREHKEPQLRLGYCELLVENRRDRLAVALDTPTENARPGDEITLRGTVTLADGRPAANAEVTLYAEDEGTLAVMGYNTPAPLAFFYQPRLLTVNAGTSFDSFIPENPEYRYFHNKGFHIGGGDGGMEALAELMRKNFDPCATWVPALVTAADGSFEHRFTLPDTLTRYRVIAVAHHGTTRFGHAESALTVSKDLMLEPKTPRFANQTDTIQPQVLVQNASAHHGTWTVGFDAHAAAGTPVCRALAGAPQTVTLAPGASATLVFPTLAETTGTAVLAWTATPVSLQQTPLDPALTRRLSDAVEARFEVRHPMPLLRQMKFVKLEPTTARDLQRDLDANLLAGRGTLDLEFSRSPLVDIGESVEFLLQYPYGCLEQTTSSLLPWCSIETLRDVLPSLATVSPARVRSALQSGADRLLTMQRSDGSFGYWPGAPDTCDWATPYAGLGLVLAHRAGAAVPEAAIASLAQYLRGSLRGLADATSPHVLETHARTLLVLAIAGKPDAAYQNALVERLPDLTPSARALLAAAIATGDPGATGDPEATGDPRAAATAREVMTSKVRFQGKDDRWMPHQPDDAFTLLAWNAIDPGGPETIAVLDRMLNNRNPYGHWHSTWANGWSLLAVAEYARHEKSRSQTVAIIVETNDGPETIHLGPDQPVASRRLELGPNLVARLTSNHAAFVRVRVASQPPVAPIQPVARNGLSIERIHQLVNPDGTVEPLTEPKPGDLIRVLLRVTLPADSTRYLVIDDPLPAVFEAVNTDFASQSAALGTATSQNDWRVSHSELRDERALFFLDYIPHGGTYTVSYLARCTLAGQATAPPAKVESMYDPDNFALSASRVFTTR